MTRERLSKETLAKRIADEMCTQIVASGLEEGERFMTLEQAAKRYGVSRTIVREAVSRLTALGILKSRQRVGLVVDRPSLVELVTRWGILHTHPAHGEDLRALAELRYVLELGAVDFAVANATGEEINRLAELAEEFEQVTRQSGQNEKSDQIELEYHSTFLAMTRNPLVAGMHRVLSEYFCASVLMNPHWREISLNTVWEHRAIAGAVERRDTEYVRGMLRRHLERALDELGVAAEISSYLSQAPADRADNGDRIGRYLEDKSAGEAAMATSAFK
jgi:DNA-binding FadR family transcriptional regulator